VNGYDFFDLCDELGLMVWEEFGINHPIEPLDPEMFLENARDRFRVRRIHPCVVIWCTANERGPREPILSAMPKLAAELDGSRPYLQHSTLKPFAEGDGPYSTHGPTYYAQLARGWRTEVGSPAVPPIESMKRIMPHEKLWPINETWATFDWVNAGETAFWCGRTEKAIAAFGEPVSIEDFCRKAQMVSMETFKAIYEAWNDKMWNNCSGVMIWMSNPCWPSLLFNTYDYYLEPTAAYFGCRKACEPIHVQWSMASNEVKAVNATLKDLTGLTADARLYNLDGSERLRNSAKLDCPANSAHKCFDLFDVETERDAAVERGLSSVYFIKLELKDSKGRLLSDNFYWQGKAPGVYQDLSGMDRVKVTGTAECAQDGDACRAEVAIDNPNKGLAVMTRLKLLDEASGLLVAPIMYSDNYFSLVPGESKAVTVEFSAKSVSGNRVSVWVEGWNVEPAKLNQLQIKRPATASN